MDLDENRLGKRTGTFVIVSLFCVYLAILCVMDFVLLPAILSGTPQMTLFDLKFFGYDAAYARSLIAGMNSRSLSLYLHVQLPLDFVYPIIYGLLYSLLFHRLYGKRMRIPVLLAASLCLADYAENTLVLVMLRQGTPGDTLVTASSTATVTKSILLLAVYGLMAAGFVAWLVNKIRKKR